MSSTSISRTLRRNAWHVFAVSLLMTVQLCMPNIVAAYYALLIRPHLKASGARQCGTYAATYEARTGDKCDAVLITDTASATEIRFYGVGGGISLTQWIVSAHAEVPPRSAD